MNVTQQIDPDILSRLRDGLCAVRCRVMDARSGCDCAIAADEIELLHAAAARLRAALHMVYAEHARDMVESTKQIVKAVLEEKSDT